MELHKQGCGSSSRSYGSSNRDQQIIVDFSGHGRGSLETLIAVDTVMVVVVVATAARLA